MEPRSRSKRSEDNLLETEDNEHDLEEEDDFITASLTGETKCKARFWKCIGGVATGSLHYMNEPEGISG